ncbi:VCBS domain-containing protein [Bradyrhizobium sp. BR13661]|uniref:VCBS domain-containing protein n=4 Tax=Bacteria TaxID=2 RepID=UPI002476249D|nr:VCBS domain-containing protein [Bradyrhizobium sp. BR13661]
MDGQGLRSPASDHIDSFTAKAHGHVPQGAVVIEDPNLIFHGDFKRAGLDLVLSHDGHEFVVHDYFRGDKRAAIASPDGAHLTGDIVSALTGYVQVAQAGAGAAAAQVIGHVTKLTGSATAIRNGVSVILNNGDNVEKGDVVSTGSDSTLGVTFIDGTVFGLSSNARMVLNEMVYDPNGSNNSSLLSLVAGTITFVAGETAKHGDMKIDTPVATMGIRGTAVLTEINFIVPSGGGDPQPQANFQVLVEPNGTTGSYILFDKLTLLPIATVNQAGQMIQISGGNVSITNALLSPDVQKLITDVFTLKFTDNGTNTKLTNNSTDSITQTGNIVTITTPDGTKAEAKFTTPAPPPSGPAPGGTPGGGIDRIPGAPQAASLDSKGNATRSFSLKEHADATADHSTKAGHVGEAVGPLSVSGQITFLDFNLGDRPTVAISLAGAPNFVYQDAGQHDVTGSLTALQKQDIAATEIKLNVVADGGNTNNGSATWTYTVPDHVFDFLAEGESLTLTYLVSVDNNFSVNPETNTFPITITIVGSNDKPVISTSVPTITFSGGTSVPGGPLTTDVPTSGKLTFTDVDLTDTHTVSVVLTSATLPDGTVVPPTPLAAFEKAMSVAIANGADATGSGTGTISWSLADLPVYLADFIPKGEVLTLVYTVTVADEHNATSTQTITVTITGTDAPAVVWIATNQPSGGFWKDAANWETGTVPTSSDDVIVITDQLHGLTPSYPVTIDAAAYANSLTMDDYDTTVHHTAPEVINKSTLTISGTLTLNADAKLTNLAGGQISVGGAIDVETITRKSGQVVTNTSAINNAGTLTLAAGGKIDTLTTIANSGLIELSGGTLTLDTGIANAGGTVQVDSVATLVADAVTIDGGTLAILGTLELDGTSLIENGTLNNSGAVNVEGAVEFANETVSNSSLGKIEVFADATLTVDKGSIINNSGNLIVDAHAEMILNDATINGGAVKGTGTIDVTGDSTIDSGATLSVATVTADAKLTLDGVTVSGSTITDNASIELDNTVKLQDGAEIKGGPVTNNGTLEVAGPATLLNDVVTNNGTVKVDGGQTLTLSGTEISSGAINGTGTIDVTGNSKIDGGATLSTSAVTVEAGTTLTLDTATVDGTTISDKGSITVDGTVKLTGGAVIKGGSSVFAPKGGSPATVEFNWGQLGTSFTVLGSPQQVVATDGRGGTVSSAGGVFQLRDQGSGWAGNFATGTHLLWDSGAGPDITIKFAAPVSSAGAQIQADYFGGFTAEIIAYDLGGNVIGTVSADGVSTSSGDGSAIFIDFVSSSADVAMVKFLLTSATYSPNDFAIGPVQFSENASFGGSGPIINNGTLKIEGPATLLDDIVTNHGTVTVDVGQTLTLSGTEISGGSIAGAGTIDITGGSAIDGGATLSTSFVTVESLQALMLDAMTVDGATITDKGSVELDATVTLKGGAKIQGTSAVVKGVVTNNGTLEIAGPATLLNDVVANVGAVQVDDGKILTLSGTEISGGTINIYSGLSGGTISVTGDSTIDSSATLNNGAVTVVSDVTLTFGDATVSASKITNSGTVKVEADKKLTLAGASLTGGALAIAGTLTSSGITTITDANISNLYLLESTLGGLLTLVATTSTPVITNDGGTIRANNAELDINTEAVTNNGTMAAINDGTLKLISTKVTNSGGAVSIESGSTLDLSGATVDGGTLTISGTLESTGTSAITSADITNTGTITVTNGALTIDPVVIHTLTNHQLLQAKGGELDISGEQIVNTADIKAIDGGILKLSKLGVTNDGGTVTVDGTSKLYLTAASINGGSLSNSGNLYGVSGLNTISAAITSTGTIEVQAGTLNLSGGLAGAGALVIDDGATLELAGATAQTVTFAGGADTLQLDKVVGQSFTGTITGQSSKGGTFTVTGAADITASSGDGLDFTASGGTSIKPANIVLTMTGNITGLAGNGITLRDSATGVGAITIDNVTGIATGTGANSEGILVENLNAANAGDISITQLGGAVGGAFGIDATTHGNGDVTIDAGSNITGSSTYAIRARSYGSGDITVTTEAGSVVTSGSSGIVAVNRATSIDKSDGSTITVNAYGTINSGSSLNQSGNTPAGIQAGYNGAITGSAANTDVNGSVVINNHANITSGGHGIHAYNYGNGDVTVNDGAGTAVTGAVAGIKASAVGGGTGDVSVNVGANAQVTGTSGYGIDAYSLNAGNISVVMSDGDVLKSGSVGIDAVNEATAIGGDVHSTIFVSARGTIHSGPTNTNSNHAPAGIMAGYTGGGSGFNGAVHGDVTVESHATITTDAGSGIAAFTAGVGTVTVTTGADSSIAAAGTAINVFDLGGGDINVTNDGSATGASGLTASGYGAGNITIANDGHITGTSGVGIGVTQALNATGQVHITNDADGHVTGASGLPAIAVNAGSLATVLIDNSGTIGPDDASTVVATTYAIFEAGGAITINNTGHINGNISVATATFNNELGGTWTISGTSVFGNLSNIDNAGEIDLHDGASVLGASGAIIGITNSGEIESWGTSSITGNITNTNTIEIHTDGILSLFGSLSGSGSVTIDANATLDVDAAVSQTITFNGGGAELRIDTSSFGGSIAGFASTDKLDLSTIKFDGGTSATYDSETGDLVVSDAYGHSVTVKLTGEDYSHAHFAGSSDGHGGTLITLNAADDAPAFNAAETSPSVSFAELDNKTGDGTTDPASGGTGTIDFTDIDLTERPTAKITHQDVTWLAADHTTALTLTPDEISALEHALTLQQTGNKNNGTIGWSYSIADSSLDFLGQGQTATVVSTITLDDHRGGTDTAQVTVTISGANDAPTLAAVTTGPLLDTAAADTFSDLTGQLVGTDADTGETATLTYAVLDAESNATTTVAGHYGSLTVNANGTYDYTPDANAINALSAGSYTDTFTVQTTDAHGATGTATFTVDVTGANDAPTVAAVTTGPLVDTAAADTFSDLTGKLVGHDADTGETATLTYAVLDAESNATTTVAGHYGSLTVNANGTYDYTPDANAINALSAGSYADTFTVQTTDAHGATGTATFTVDVTGANDAPTVAAVTTGPLVDTAAADTFSDLTGQLVGHDADTGETATLTYAVLDAESNATTTVAGHYGSLTVNANGTYDYTPDANAINALPAGSYTDTFTVQTTDAHGATGTATFTVDVTGANDAPTVAAVTTGPLVDTAAADTFSDLTGQLVGTDADTGETATLTYAVLDAESNATTTVAGHYGSLTVHSDGSYDYLPDAAAINALSAGSYADTFTVQTTDANGATGTATFTVDVTGANDAPVVTQASLAVSQGGTTTLSTADLNYADPDGPNGFVTYTVSNVTHGYFVLDHDGKSDVADSFTSDDVGAGRVHFVDDGDASAPTFSVTANDGILDGSTVEANINFTPALADHTLTSTAGVSILVSPYGATSGFVFPGANNVTTPGTPEDRIVLGYVQGRSTTVLNADPMEGWHDFTPISSVFSSTATGSMVTTKLDAANGVTLTQAVSLGADANFFTTTVDIKNGSASDLTDVRFMRTFDPDQDINRGTFSTYNDVVQNPDTLHHLAIVSATGPYSGVDVALVGLDDTWRGSVFGFTNTDPYDFYAYDNPIDPNGSLADVAISLTDAIGTIAAGDHVQVTYLTTTNVATDGSNALYGTAGNDTIDGLGGDDLLIGLDGADTFVFAPGSGHDTILDFTPGTDKIALNGFAGIPLGGNGSFSEANLDTWKATPGVFETVGSDVLIHLSADDSILLKHVKVGDLHATDFIAGPEITGDLATAVVKGNSVKLTGLGAGAAADLLAIDPGTTADHLVYTVTHANHGHLANALDGPAITSFTQADIDNGHVVFVADDPTYVGGANFTVTLSDGIARPVTPTATVGVNIVDAQIAIKTGAGFDFDQDDPIGTFGAGRIQESHPPTTFTVANLAANRDFIVKGVGLAFAGTGDDLHLTGGTITSIEELTHDTSAPLLTLTLYVSATDWMNGTAAQAHGDKSLMDALTKSWAFNVIGNAGADNVGANALNDVFTGNGGDDSLDGSYGYDRANYGNATGPIDVHLAAGIVTGDASVGRDTLKSIELVTGTNFNDVFDARGFSSTSDNAGSIITANTAGMFNEFEGRGGDDTITGNGVTRISYAHATSGVTVTFHADSWTSSSSGGSGTATGDMSTGTDTFTGVFSVRGSSYADTFHGSNNPSGSAEEFEGRGGNDLIDGGGGFDRARYDGAVDGVGILVNLADGTVSGGSDTGTDTLRSVEAIWGTNYDDTYNAAGFTASSTNAGSAGANGSGAAFNEFEGGGGSDTVIGNGNTRVTYVHANSGVTVTLGSSGSGDAYGDSSVGHDHFTGGVNAVRGSEFNDIIVGNGGNNVLEGRGGNDVLRGMAGNDTLTGGTGADIFVYDRFGNGSTGHGTGTGGIDTITDFNSGEGDRIDLRSLTNLTSFSQILANALETGSGPTLKTTITFGGDDTTELVLLGVSKASLKASDFILHSATHDSVAVTVQTPDGYDFSTLYTDMSVSTLATAANTIDHIFAVDSARGITFELIGSSFNYDSTTHKVTGGTITEIDILNGTDPAQTTQDHVLVNSNGWSINATNFFAALGQYGSLDPSTHATGKLALDNIFGSAIYSYVGSVGAYDEFGRQHLGADTFVGGNNADVFNGLSGPSGPLDHGQDTVDYSNAPGAVSVNLLTGATAGSAAGDVFISIENLRGSSFGDTLTGDGNDNVLEGGGGNDVIDGGAGFNTASYAHASTGVTVSLAAVGPQDTIGAGIDTLVNIQALRGSDHDDTLTGNGASVLEGGLGHNNLIGQAGQSDTASYEHAAAGVTVDLSITVAQDTKGAGVDTLTNIANLSGSHFNDILTGDSHDNLFMGNGGQDTFVFKTVGGIGHDTIGDFVSGQDHLRLDVAAFDVNDPGSFNAWYGAHVAAVNSGSDLLIDLNHDGKDTILLKNASVGGLHAHDFILPAGGA